MHAFFILAALLATAADAASVGSRWGPETYPTIDLDYSSIKAFNYSEAAGTYVYKNIRFAQAPVGDLRWAPPQPPLKEPSVNAGVQSSNGTLGCSIAEDCLFLDVWAPPNKGKKLPVMFYVYGGGFRVGSKNPNTPEGLYALNQNFVFVAANYRLGYTGYAGGPTFSMQATPNVGLMDVAASLAWTKKYVASFGGDPNAITAVGLSAGSSQILSTLTRYGGHNTQLFARAYVQSPALRPFAGHAVAEDIYQKTAALVGCLGGDIGCMRKVPFVTVNAAAANVSGAAGVAIQPQVDGGYFADTYEYQFNTNKFNFDGPMVIGHAQHEVNGVPSTAVTNNSDSGVVVALTGALPLIRPSIQQQALTLYPAANYPNASLRYADIDQSFEFTSKILAVTRALKNQTYNYVFGVLPAAHTSDNPFYWYGGNHEAPSPAFPVDVIIPSIAVQMQKYLLSFVLTGDPNAAFPSSNQTTWPRYGAGQVLAINSTGFTVVGDELATSASAFWNKALWY